MKAYRGGSSLVEFVLVFPGFFFLLLVILSLAFLCVQKIELERLSFEGGRWLSAHPIASESELLELLRGWVERHTTNPTDVSVHMEEIPTLEDVSTTRARKKVSILQVTLKRQWKIFRLASQSEFVKVFSEDFL